MVKEAVILFIAYILTIYFFWGWIKKGEIKNVSQTPKVFRKIAIRTALSYFLLWGLCWYIQVNVLIPLITIAILVPILLFAPELLGEMGVFAALPLFISYVLFQWILGFPDKDLWIPPNKKYKSPVPQPSHLVGKTGLAETPLRPVGEIIIDREKHTATSQIDFIEKDTPVTVIAVKNNTLIVRVHPTQN